MTFHHIVALTAMYGAWDIKYGDIIYVEPKQDVNNWNKFKEIMSVVGQIATLLAVVQSAQN